MDLKITGVTKERFEKNLKDILNVSAFVCLQGYIPDEQEIEEPIRSGKWWFRESEPNRFQLVPTTNNYWANIIDEGNDFIVIRFNIRYDRDNKKSESLSNLISSWFSDNVEIVG
jgi:hypothetical protein